MIIGSCAILYHFPDYPKIPKDLDVNGTHDVYSEKLRIERHDIPYINRFSKNGVISPNALLTLKLSHTLNYDINHDKHAFDIQFLVDKNCIVYYDLLNELIKHWENVHGKNVRSNLNMSKDDFFNNAITCPIKHDDLHELLVKHDYFKEKKPTYKNVLKDNCEVDVSEIKWNYLSPEQKFNLVFEEVAVMAFERFSNYNYKVAYSKMLKKFIISHAPIWEAIYILMNHRLFKTKIPFNYIKHLWNQEN